MLGPTGPGPDRCIDEPVHADERDRVTSRVAVVVPSTPSLFGDESPAFALARYQLEVETECGAECDES